MIICLSQVSSTIGNESTSWACHIIRKLIPHYKSFSRTLKRGNARSRKKRPGMWRNVQSRLTSWKKKWWKMVRRESESGRIACHAWTLFCSWGVTIEQLKRERTRVGACAFSLRWILFLMRVPYTSGRRIKKKSTGSFLLICLVFSFFNNMAIKCGWAMKKKRYWSISSLERKKYQ